MPGSLPACLSVCLPACLPASLGAWVSGVCMPLSLCVGGSVVCMHLPCRFSAFLYVSRTSAATMATPATPSACVCSNARRVSLCVSGCQHVGKPAGTLMRLLCPSSSSLSSSPHSVCLFVLRLRGRPSPLTGARRPSAVPLPVHLACLQSAEFQRAADCSVAGYGGCSMGRWPGEHGGNLAVCAG
jgi:hypothetical protein